jgi:prolyl-tRNA editing enzyme YbaK/EbsC (Cys-tRNA(Pro) deacylase)
VANWPNSFKPGGWALNALERLVPTIDAALLIATPDDTVRFRGAEYPAPRDNILFELGFFTAALGRHRTALVCVQEKDRPPLKLPTDLDGLTVIMYDPAREAGNERALCGWLHDVRAVLTARAVAWHHINRTREVLDEVADPWLPYISNTMLTRHVNSVATASKGSIELRPLQYYKLIYEEMDSASDETQVRAVASLSPTRWVHSEEQKGYVDKNIAAAKRGVKIRRLFVLPENVHGSVTEIAQRMADSNIAIRFARPGPWSALHKIQDIVMFSDKSAVQHRAYIAYPDADYPLRIDTAELSIEPLNCQERANVFDRLWDLAAELQAGSELVHLDGAKTGSAPPGHSMSSYLLDRPVVTCSEAAMAKQIPLQMELKTLILETSAGLVAVHVPGDRSISLRAVKKALKCREAKLASRGTLAALGLAPGTVTPLLDPVWYMHHLLCESVLALPFVSTNCGTLTGYFKFSPQVLLHAANVTVGPFSRSIEPTEPSVSS